MLAKELILYVLLYGLLFGLGALVLPLYAYFPLAILATAVHVYVINRKKRKRYESILDSIATVQSESMPALKRPDAGTDVDSLMYDSLKEVVTELEKKYFQLVEKNIQLLSLKELGMTIISSVDEMRVVESVTSFLSKGLGFKEFFISIFNPDEKVFNIYSYREALGERGSARRSVDLKDMGGLLHKAVVTRRPIFIKDPEMHPIGTIENDSLFAGSTMSAFVLVPLLKSAASKDCWNSGDCVLNPGKRAPENDFELVESRCPACKRFPILGVIGVTDGFKAGGLSQVDLVSVETLALQVSTILENTQLYNEIKKGEIFRENVINSMMNGLITTDHDGNIMLSNQTAEKLSGYSRDELSGRSLDSILVDSGTNGQEGSVTRILKLGKGSYEKEMWLIKKDGEKIPIVLNTSFLVDENRKVQGILAVFFDLTRIKMMEKKIKHLDKLAALGRFSSSIAHEIRNPLTGIAAGIQYLKRAGNIPEDQIENVTFILKEVNRIDRLIGDLMNIVREGDLIYDNTEIESIVRNSITSLSDLIERRNVTVNTIFPEKSRPVQIDSDRITQVLINLIKNAVEASAPGDEVRVEVTFPDEVDHVLFDGIGNYVIINVTDYGSGLSAEEREKIFEPFFSTKQNGTGLGLYVAHNFVERHGGSIFVESDRDKGTTFTLYLPTEKTQHGTSDKVSYPLGG